MLRHTIDKYDLLERGSTVIVGVSGGPDSLCLLHALNALASEYDLRLHVAHLNHQLRGDEASADADFVRSIAEQWQLPCTIEARDVAEFATGNKLSIEEAARQVRYGFLIEVALAQHTDTIAVAHNADDQTESVLMHFLRGSGLSGLRGMLPKSFISDFRSLILDPAQAGLSDPEIRDRRLKIYLVRPLLEIPRSDIEDYNRQHSLQPRLDATNADTTYFRNRLRHELLPQLEDYNPNIRAILRRTASVIAADAEVLETHLNFVWGLTVKEETSTAITFDLALWREQLLGAQRALLRRAIQQLRPPLRDVDFVHVEAAIDLLQRATTGDQVTLPQNLMLEVSYDTFTIADQAERPLPDWPLLPDGSTSLPLALPGSTALPDSDWIVEATFVSEAANLQADQWTAYLNAEALAAPLTLRARTTADRFQPQGMPQSLQLKDWMISAKIPRAVRDRLPLIESQQQIVWVAGFRIGQPFIVTDQTQRIVKLTFKKK